MRKTALLVGAVVGALMLAGCASEPDPPSSADTTFAQDMMISASVAMDLADQARSRATDPNVREVADSVYQSVVPMADRLTELGPQLAASGAKGFAHDDAEGHEDASIDRATKLRTVPAKRFDATFLKFIGDELRAGQQIAITAQSKATDSRTLGMADAAALTWAELIKQVDSA